MGEVGLAGVSVALQDASGNTLAETVTDGFGQFLVDELTPGDYRLQITRPDGYRLTAADVGRDDGRDSDFARATGTTEVISISAGEVDTSLDAGLFRRADLVSDVAEARLARHLAGW